METPTRRSARLSSVCESPPATTSNNCSKQKSARQTPSRSKSENGVSFAPTTPSRRCESVQSKRGRKRKLSPIENSRGLKRRRTKHKKRKYYRKVAYDDSVFEIEDTVYVKRREDSSDEEDPEVEECKICFKVGKELMIECDECLGGFHLKCLKPPLKDVPSGDWICLFCKAEKSGKVVSLPTSLEGKKRARSCREKLLACDLYAARIESIWREVDGSYWFRARWYITPEETESGRQPHNLRRELYRTNDFADVEMECIIRHCYIMEPKEYANATNEGDDVFLCEYEYDIQWHSFKRLAGIEDTAEHDESSDDDWDATGTSDLSEDEDTNFEKENISNLRLDTPSREFAANTKKGYGFGLNKIGTKKIPAYVRSNQESDIERAKALLLLSTFPKSLPCRQKEISEITAFLKSSIQANHCLGNCLYIHGVPGTGKTMTVLSVMRNLRAEVDRGSVRPYCFVEINGLKLSSPESIYQVIYEALSGHRVGWKKALQILNERFSEETKIRKEDDKPCILLIDELDLLVTRNQSVLYNILDWPTKPNANLIVIGIANTMDLPEKLLPRISSRMGIQRLCFSPYNHQQLNEIISDRLKGTDAFETQAIEFAARKVAAISGDARRALEICRRAAEIADYRSKNPPSNSTKSDKRTVGMSEVEAAIQEMFQAPHIQIIKSLSKYSKIFLTAMVYEAYKTGMTETTFEKLSHTISQLCGGNKEIFPGFDELLKLGCRLGESRLIICEAGAKHKLQKLQLNFPSDDVAFALKNCKELTWISKFL